MDSPRGINNRSAKSEATKDSSSSSSSRLSSRAQYVIAVITIGFQSIELLFPFLSSKVLYLCLPPTYLLVYSALQCGFCYHVGAAIGNIFVMKNRKNFKFKFFKDEAQKAREHRQRYQNHSKSSSGSGSSSSNSSDNSNRKGHRP